MNLRGTHKLMRRFEAVPSSVPLARRQLTDFAASIGATDEEIESIRLATSEALTNVVVHAYRGRRGKVYVSTAIAAGELWVLIGDDGCGLHAGAQTPGLGMGLALIAELTDNFAVVKRFNGGTEVRMRFDLASASAEEDDQSSAASATRPASSVFSTTT
jgi:anti-sigma regulatory factor (Ser/Thr protein kinase)